jgi:hypothetical protein
MRNVGLQLFFAAISCDTEQMNATLGFHAAVILTELLREDKSRIVNI